VITSWQNDFRLLFGLIEFFYDLLSMGAVQTCASSLPNSNLLSERLC